MSDALPSERDSLPLASDAVDAVCGRFKDAWEGGPRPRIQDHLIAIPQTDRPLLLRELIMLDLYYRTKVGEQAQP
jgi:hypothetical protein